MRRRDRYYGYGIDITATRDYEEDTVPEGSIAYAISVKGLHGGHSGMDIHLGFGNANKIMNRLLFKSTEEFGIGVSQIDGGSLRNAIPRESFATVVLRADRKEDFEVKMSEWITEIKNENSLIETNLEISLNKVEIPAKMMGKTAQDKILRAVYGAHNGVYGMSAAIPDLVETSNNIAKIEVKSGKISIGCLTRSSVNSAKTDLANSLKSVFELADCKVTLTGEYPGWSPNPNSEILEVLKDQYEILFDEQPQIVACHAGLECGILGKNYPDMDMISFGPTIKGAHSPDERVSISSVKKFWTFLLQILKNTP
jgi:dipeptidase D